MNLDSLYQAAVSLVRSVNELNQTLATTNTDLGTIDGRLVTANTNLAAIASNLAARLSTDDYPVGATPVAGTSGNVANAQATATLSSAGSSTTYISGFAITSSGSTAAAVVTALVTGIGGGDLVYTYATVAGATTANAALIVEFPRPIPASAVNTPIAVVLPALGAGNTNATVVAYGYRL